ncbi:MAG: hypothetical protein ABR500_11870 [Dermatophilaceae bacterium]|nr:hypothetical protein [Intrasporangiaceae bacterium]
MSSTATRGRRVAGGLMALALAGSMSAAASAAPDSVGAELAQVRAATAEYHSVDAAVAAGYEPVSPCVPNMGYHYGRGVAATASDLDATSPEILVYAPRRNGSLKLVAVEYATWDGSARLFGQAFQPPHPAGGPPFHTLHAWIWQGNPAGTFAALNPNVRCT